LTDSGAALDRGKQATASQPDPLQPQDLVITFVGAYARGYARVWSGGLVSLLGDFGFSPGASRVALTRMVRRELLRPVRTGRVVHYEPTERLIHILDQGDDRIYRFGQSERTAGQWTVLWHSIPERLRMERGLLGAGLRFLGFGSIQYATWVCPHDREQAALELVTDLGVAAHTVMFVGLRPGILELEPMIVRAWDLQALTARYRRFVEEFEPYSSRRACARLDDRDAFAIRTRLMHAYRGFMSLDPELPDRMMPGARWRTRAIHIFGRASAALEEPAFRYFREVAHLAGERTSDGRPTGDAPASHRRPRRLDR
jgi:phenylacetic acid degradation operon negative regulatory protein